MAKSILQARRECYVCRRWYNVSTLSGLEEHHILTGPLRSFAEREGLKVWLCHRHHNEPGFSAHFDQALAAELKQTAQTHYEDAHGIHAHEQWMTTVGKDYQKC